MTARETEPSLTELEGHNYLFGHKLTHSLSPLMHATVYDALGLRWRQLRLESDDLSHFLSLVSAPGCVGSSVTMPNKVAIVPRLDRMTDECREVGACNTVFWRDDPENPGQRLLWGANTDVAGVREALVRNVPNPETSLIGKPALVLGGGGAARSAVYALHRYLQAPRIYLINRDAGEVQAVLDECAERGFGDRLVHVTSVEQAAAAEVTGAIVTCVPDFPPRTEAEILTRRIFEIFLAKGSGALLEMCYNPSPYTELGALAGKAGWQVILGTEALIWQGIEQDMYWTGKSAEELPVEKVQEVIAAKLASRPKL